MKNLVEPRVRGRRGRAVGACSGMRPPDDSRTERRTALPLLPNRTGALCVATR